MNQEAWLNMLETTKVKYFSNLVDRAETYRKKILIPLCRRYKLGFLSGMGTFYFYPEDDSGDRWTIHDHDEAILEERTFLLPYLDVLYFEHEQGQRFGFLVGDVQPGIDYK